MKYEVDDECGLLHEFCIWAESIRKHLSVKLVFASHLCTTYIARREVLFKQKLMQSVRRWRSGDAILPSAPKYKMQNAKYKRENEICKILNMKSVQTKAATVRRSSAILPSAVTHRGRPCVTKMRTIQCIHIPCVYTHCTDKAHVQIQKMTLQKHWLIHFEVTLQG